MDVSNQVKKILISLFASTAFKNKIERKEVKLIFQLKSSTFFNCKFKGNEVRIEDAGITAQMFKGKINSFIVEALIMHGNKNNIDKSQVNILMQIDELNNLTLFLRNGNDIVQNIELTDLLK